MAEMDDIQRRWRELAEQLGLPPEPSAPAERVAIRAPSVQAPVPQPVETRDDRLQRGDEERPLEEVREKQSEGDIAEPAQAATEPEEPPSEERRHARGRRSGRRGGRKTEASAAETAEEEAGAVETALPAASEEDEPTAPERSRRRGRGRSRSKKADTEEVRSDSAEASEEQRAEESEPDLAADEDDDMSGWSIPSWQELISSLYRPDR